MVGVLSALTACGDSMTPDLDPDLDPDIEPAIVDVALAGLDLSPSFSPDITDYTVRCAGHDGPIDLEVTDERGAESTTLDLVEDQLVSVRDRYWIRCLPADFPAVTPVTHDELERPASAWYLANTNSFVVVFDDHGTPVWYRRGTRPKDLKVIAPNTLAYVLEADAGSYSLNPGSHYTLDALATGTRAEIHAYGLSRAAARARRQLPAAGLSARSPRRSHRSRSVRQ